MSTQTTFQVLPLSALYGFQLPDVDNFVRVSYKDGLMIFYTSNYLSHIT